MKPNIALPDWAKETNCAITVTDAEGKIIYMNDKSLEVNAKYGNPVGHNLSEYHNERAMGIIRQLLDTGGINAYTIQKGEVKKLIYQTAWFESGKVAGLIEISIPLPSDLPHYVRS